MTAERMRSLPIAAIYSSDLPRAVQTAEIIRDGIGEIPYRKKRNLRECHLPSPVFDKVPANLVRHGERQVAAVFGEHFRPCRGPDRHEIIVSHGNVIRYLVCLVIGRPRNSWLRLRTQNCGISEIAIEADRRMWVVSYNDVGHLPLSLITYGMPRTAYSSPRT